MSADGEHAWPETWRQKVMVVAMGRLVVIVIGPLNCDGGFAVLQFCFCFKTVRLIKKIYLWSI